LSNIVHKKTKKKKNNVSLQLGFGQKNKWYTDLTAQTDIHRFRISQNQSNQCTINQNIIIFIKTMSMTEWYSVSDFQ